MQHTNAIYIRVQVNGDVTLLVAYADISDDNFMFGIWPILTIITL